MATIYLLHVVLKVFKKEKEQNTVDLCIRLALHRELTSDFYVKFVWTLDVLKKEEGSLVEGNSPTQTITGQPFRNFSIQISASF